MKEIRNEQATQQFRILIINFHSTENAGDLSLLITTRDLLKEVFHNPVITVSANWLNELCFNNYDFSVVPSLRSIIQSESNAKPLQQAWQFLRLLFWLNPWKKHSKRVSSWVNKNNLDILRKAYNDSDIVIAAPGNQIYSSGKFGWPYPVTIAAIQLANWYKKPLIVLPQSLGPLRRPWEKKLLLKAYSPAKLIYLRDAVSLRLAEQINLGPENVSFSWDLAFRFQPAGSVVSQNILQRYGIKQGKFKVGVTLISTMGRSLNQTDVINYYSVMKQSLIKFSKSSQFQLVLFAQVSGPSSVEDDRIPTRQLFQGLLSEGVDVIFVDECLSPDLLKACYGQMDMFVASRLHSGIFAFSMQVPTLFIGYLTKTIGMLESLGMPEIGIDIASLNSEKLYSKLIWLWADRNRQKNLIRTKLIDIEHDMCKQTKKLGALFGNQ